MNEPPILEGARKKFLGPPELKEKVMDVYSCLKSAGVLRRVVGKSDDCYIRRVIIVPKPNGDPRLTVVTVAE